MSQDADLLDPKAWMLFMIIGAVNAVQGSLLMVFGGEVEQETIQRLVGSTWAELQASNPPLAGYVDNLLLIVGLFLGSFGLLTVAIACTGYRRRQVWAWYAMWIVPAFYLVTALLLFSEGEIYFTDDLSYEYFAFLTAIALIVQTVEARAFRRRG